MSGSSQNEVGEVEEGLEMWLINCFDDTINDQDNEFYTSEVKIEDQSLCLGTSFRKDFPFLGHAYFCTEDSPSIKLYRWCWMATCFLCAKFLMTTSIEETPLPSTDTSLEESFEHKEKENCDSTTEMMAHLKIEEESLVSFLLLFLLISTLYSSFIS